MTYKGYDLRPTLDLRVAVYAHGKVQFVAETVGKAKRWVTAYRNGVTWAVVAKLEQDKLLAALTS
jgi:hypothetical protein